MATRTVRATLAGRLALAVLAGFLGCGPGPSGTTQVPHGSTGSVADTKKSAGEKSSGSIKIVGSDTMVNLNTRWAEGFKKKHPGVTVEVEGKGSGTAPPALVGGNATFGAMSREFEPSEIDAFKKAHGYEPTALPVAIDLIAVYVHKDNPIKALTLAQVDAAFSKTRKAGGSEVKTWGDLGLAGEWADKPVSLYGRDNASGTAKYLREFVMKKGDYKDEVKQQPGSAGVVQSVAKDKFGIGYSGIGYKNADVRVVPLAKEKDKPGVEADEANARNGSYPLARELFLCLNYKPGSDLDPVRHDFLSYVLSPDGQKDVMEDGYLALEPEDVKKAREKVGLK